MKFYLPFKFTALTIVLLLLGSVSYATHLRAGEIKIERVSCNNLTFRITVTVFTNTINTNVLFGGEDDFLDFGDGTDPDKDGRPGIKVPEQKNIDRPDLGNGVATASYTILHTYSGPGAYTISYSEPNRNDGVVNMDASVNTRFYIETQIFIDPTIGCNNTPQLLIPPIDKACTGVAFLHNPGAFDPDGDSLSFELVIPFREKESTVINYKDPNNSKFYTNFSAGNETGDGPPTFSINPIEGTLRWDAPGMAGEYNIAFIVVEWRKVFGQWQRIGFVRRDMQIIVDDCDNERPDVEIPEDTCVVAGTTLKATIYGLDVDGDDVKIEAFSEIFNFAAAESPATVTPFPAVFQSTMSGKAKLEFEWNTECLHVKDQPYVVTFKVTDKARAGSPPKTQLVTFKSWLVRVVGPEPEWVSANVNLSNRSANLTWEPYVCQNADSIHVWRRVDSFTYDPAHCETGMPAFLGYELIAKVPVKTSGGTPITQFVDTNNGEGLASGARYCYRLVAGFPEPRGGESYVSEEICIGPILADEPIITNVTVDKTDPANGQITVKWREPFEADQSQFPPPYTYDVFRAEGFAGDQALTKITGPLPISALTFSDVGVNSEEKVFNYRVIAYASNGNPLDTSATASTVRLEAESQLNRIVLNWTAFVPWSNLRQRQPNKHFIYRGPEGATDDQLALIDSVDVISDGFVYVDEGQYNNTPLVPNTLYCYKVRTRGGYGNPAISEPLINFSQKLCAAPSDTTPPCSPQHTVAVNPQNCQDYLDDLSTCNTNLFTNVIRWSRAEDPDCRVDVSYYKIYVASTTTADYFELIDDKGQTVMVRDTFYIHSNLPSFANCYRVSAVDRSGNESELSEPVCFDNCPYYELPNVFTPNSDDCNKVFSAYSNNSRYTTEGEEAPCGGVVDQHKCARFVQKVVFRVYNRWGKEVYTYESGSERSIYIDWDGRGNDRTELATGIYYYVADVTFVSVDPTRQNKIIKGWVHLIR